MPILLVLAFVGLLLVGCAEQAAEECSRDVDCDGSNFCVDAVCVAECTHDDECFDGSYCEVYQRQGTVDPIQVCLDEFSASNGGVDCETDAQCQEILRDPAARCGIHQRCVLTPETSTNQADLPDDLNSVGNGDPDQDPEVPATALRHLLIIEQLNDDGTVHAQQVTEDADENQAEAPPADENGRRGRSDDDNENSDDDGEEQGDEDRPKTSPVRLGAVVVRNEAHELVGFGQVTLLTPPELNGLPSDLMAAPISLDEYGTCLEDPASRPYTSLGGPGGRAVIELLDRHQTHLELSQGWRIEVIAAGPTCPIGPPASLVADDPGDEYHGPYRVLLCDVEDELVAPEPQDCIEIDGPLKYYSDLEVTLGL